MNSLLRSACLVTTGLVSGLIMTMSFNASAEKRQTVELPLEDIQLFADVFGSIKHFYVDEVSDSKLLENAIKGMVEGLDPHSSYLDFKAFKAMEESTSGEFGGLGIEVTKDSRGVRVVSPIDDTPAARAGVMAGDLIIKIDDKATADLSLNENVKLMRGKPNTSIVLTIARKGEAKPIVLKIVRDIIKIQSVKSKPLSDGLGYVRFSQFQEHTTDDFAKALTKLHETNNLKGLVIDLRNNPGGLLNSAIGVSAAFLPHNALVVSTRGRDAESERLFKATLEDYRTSVKEKDFIASLPAATRSVPIVVLINPASASASEIVAGALQDHKRATIMGSRSFGKGSVQTILSLRVKGENTNGLKLTTARYYTPSGRTIQAKGITPDIAVDDTPEGNYPSFNLREADLAHHLEDKTNKRNDHNEDSEEDALEDHEFTMPKLRYVFGDEKDFPLQQAKAHLLGQKVVTHEDVQAKLKAERQAQDSAKKKDQPE